MWNIKSWKRAARTLLLGTALLGGAAGASILVNSVERNDLRHHVQAVARDRTTSLEELKLAVAPYSFSFAHHPTYEEHHRAMLEDLAALGFRRIWTRAVDGQGSDGFYSPGDDVTLICAHWSTPATATAPDTYTQAVSLVPGRVRRGELPQ